jgi:hypothetical protein
MGQALPQGQTDREKQKVGAAPRLRSFAERTLEAVKEVLPKASLGNSGCQVTVGRRDDSNVDSDRRAALSQLLSGPPSR